jgi:RNA polymerase sigma-70 factor (ECF subfamily)
MESKTHDPDVPTPATLWEELAPHLRSFVARRAPRGVDIDDVVQEVFLRIQEQLPRLRDAGRIQAWIFQIARNVVADAFRSRSRREALVERTANEVSLAPKEVDERTGEAELASCLMPMVRRLPEPYRQAIELTELRGVSQVEAARLAGISVSGMKSRVQRGREHIRRALEDICRIELDVRGGVVACSSRSGAACGGCRPAAPER